MAAVWFRARTDLRRSWRSTLALALLVGVASGVVIAAAAGACRTDSAYPRFLAATKAPDIFVFNPPSGEGGSAFAQSTTLAVPAVALVANLLAALPVWSAGRAQPALVLRAE